MSPGSSDGAMRGRCSLSVAGLRRPGAGCPHIGDSPGQWTRRRRRPGRCRGRHHPILPGTSAVPPGRAEPSRSDRRSRPIGRRTDNATRQAAGPTVGGSCPHFAGRGELRYNDLMSGPPRRRLDPGGGSAPSTTESRPSEQSGARSPRQKIGLSDRDGASDVATPGLTNWPRRYESAGSLSPFRPRPTSTAPVWPRMGRFFAIGSTMGYRVRGPRRYVDTDLDPPYKPNNRGVGSGPRMSSNGGRPDLPSRPRGA